MYVFPLTYALLGLFLAASPVFAASFPFEEARPLYVGARALGMGNAFTQSLMMPGRILESRGIDSVARGETLLALISCTTDRTTVLIQRGIGYAYRGYGLFWGNKIALGVESGTPDFNYYSVARQISPHVAIGASLKFKRKHPSDYYQFFGHSPSYDLGLLVKPRTDLRFGLLASHLPGERGIRWLTLGTAYQWKKTAVCGQSRRAAGAPQRNRALLWY